MTARLVLRWFAFLALSGLAKLAAIFLAPGICWLGASPDRRHLRAPWRWMETVDWDMAGDPPWRAHRLIGTAPLSWLNRTRWIWRNGAQAVAYGICGASAADPQREVDGSWYRLTLTDSAFYWRADWPVSGRCIELRAGWKLNYQIEGRHKVALSFRIRKLEA